jgi:tetratricopeptide (TPR) repeat protein
VPNRQNGRVSELTSKGLKDRTANYLRAIERFDLDPILPQLSVRFTAEVVRRDKAERELLAAAELAPELPEAYKFLGVLSLRKGEFGKAGQYFKESLRRAVRPDALTLLGVAKFRLDKLWPARRTFQRAIATDSTFKEAYYNLALTYAYKRPDRVISFLEKALEIDSTYAAAHRELGWTLKQRGQYSEAERHLKKAIKYDKSEGWAYIYLGNLMWSVAKPVEAERAYKAAIKAWPAEGTPYWCLADFYKDTGRLKKAEALYEKAVRLDPDDSVAHARLGFYLKQIGELEKAKSSLECALGLDPGYERVKAGLDEIKRISGDG